MVTKKTDSVDDLLDEGTKSAGDENIDELLDEVKPTPKVGSPKVSEPKAPRALKGRMCTFLTKNNGQRVIGMGTDYIVARMGGKLYYKEMSQVQFLPDDWKEGDPIPGVADYPPAPQEPIDDLA